MRKEVIFAIIIGLFLGLVILYGIRIANQSTKQTSSTPTPTPTEIANPTPTTLDSGITITSPNDHDVINTSTIKVTGKTLPNQAVAINNSEDDTIVTSDKDGLFSYTINLAGGENIIKATVLKPDQTTESTQISIIYTTAKVN